jgi:hypothetical protein
MRSLRPLWAVIGSFGLMVGGVVWATEPAPLDLATVVPTNQRVAQIIAQSIARAVPERGYSVDVLSVDGTVTLRGIVSTSEQLAKVIQATEAVDGVLQITNEITVAKTAIHAVRYLPDTNVVEAPQELAPAVPDLQETADPVPQHVFTRQAAHQYDWPFMPNFSWPASAPYPNYSAVQYPRSYSKKAFPHIGPFHPYPEPPLDWRKVTLRYLGGHWFLKFGQPNFLLRSIRYYY